MPLPRLEASDLKCKNGCDYYGNPQWQGYCSKCYREQASRQRKAEKASASSSATLPKPEHKKQERSVKNSSFSKFEEKRLRQTETHKKANLLKLSSVFKKSSNDDHDRPTEKKQSEFKVPSQVFENMKKEFKSQFPAMPQQVDRDCRMFVNTLILDTIKCCHAMSADELSERVQRQYQRFMKYMDSSPHFVGVDSDTKELLVDFVETHAMSYLHELPSVVFSPNGTDDERLDRVMSERIQQLSWVEEKHLDCKLDKMDAACRGLLYTAISDLLGMDSAASPGGKLSLVRGCCRRVVALCARAALAPSADELLPALIFTVLKANPPRLVSNINFVTRFSNAQRLMTGEGGYYFTNLCCAVSFIETLSAESLNMDKKEFDCYMGMPATIGGSSWACALSLSGAVRDADDALAQMRDIKQEAADMVGRAQQLVVETDALEKEIAQRVSEVLAKSPLVVSPRRPLPRLQPAPLVDIAPPSEPTQNNQEEKLTILGFEVVDPPSKSPQNLSNSMELLSSSASPLGFTLGSRSEAVTPDEFREPPGLANVNYDIDLSDISAENSVAEDTPKRRPTDPFSPDEPFEPLSEVDRMADAFYEFALAEQKRNEDLYEFNPTPGGLSPSVTGVKAHLRKDHVVKPTFPFAPNKPGAVLPHRIDPFSPTPSEMYSPKQILFAMKQADPFAPKPGDPYSQRQIDLFTKQNDPFAPVQSDPFSPKQNDPFSPVGLAGPQKSSDPFSATSFSVMNNATIGSSMNSLSFDPFASPSSDGKAVDPFGPIGSSCEFSDLVSPERKEGSILDDSDSPTGACLLPSPLLPQSSKQS